MLGDWFRFSPFVVSWIASHATAGLTTTGYAHTIVVKSERKLGCLVVTLERWRRMKIVKVSQITLYPLPLTPSRQGREDMLLPSPSMGEGQGEGVDSFSVAAACPEVLEKTRDSTET